MTDFDIQKIPRHRPHEMGGNGNSQGRDRNRNDEAIPASSQFFQPAPEPVPENIPHIPDPEISLAAEKLKRQYAPEEFSKEYYGAPLAAAKVVPPVVSSPAVAFGNTAPGKANPVAPEPKHKLFFRFRKVYVLFAFTLLVLGSGIFMGARFISFASSISTASTSFYKTVTDNIGAVLGPIIPGLRQLDTTKVGKAIQDKGQINVLLLGYGGEGHSGSYLTDTIMLLHVDFSTNTVTYIPVPRDIWVQIPTHGYDGSYAKINAAYEFGIDTTHYPNKLPQFSGEDGGGDLAAYEVAQVTGITPDYYVSVDFDGFKDVVDALGGVTVNVENTFTDYSYPSGDASTGAPFCSAADNPDNVITNCRYKIVHFDKGPQFMDGARALEYARSRHAAGVEGSDYARSRRQQLLISAIEQRAVSLGALPKVLDVMDSIQGHFRTNMSLAEIKDLSQYIGGKSSQTNETITISDGTLGLIHSTYSADGQWILVPSASSDINDWSAVHTYIAKTIAAENSSAATAATPSGTDTSNTEPIPVSGPNGSIASDSSTSSTQK